MQPHSCVAILPCDIPSQKTAFTCLSCQINNPGDHLRKRRLDLKLLQRDVAQRIGVNKTTIHNWETNRTQPDLYMIPKVIEFIGRIPFDMSTMGFGEKIKIYRQVLGITRKYFAKQLGIDPSTLGKGEKGKGRPSKELLQTISDLSSTPTPWHELPLFRTCYMPHRARIIIGDFQISGLRCFTCLSTPKVYFDKRRFQWKLPIGFKNMRIKSKYFQDSNE